MQIKVRLDSRPIQRWARLFSKQTLLRAARAMGPTLVALTFAGVAHAQGTMDFSGAQTLMGTFKTFAIYAGAVICFGGLIFAGIRMMSGRFQDAIPGLFGALFGAGVLGCPVHHPKPRSQKVADDPKAKAQEERQRREVAIANTTGIRTLAAIAEAVPVRLMKRDLLFVAERLASLLGENRLSIVARRYGIKKAKDTDSLGKLFAAYLRRAEESVLGSVLVETTILYMSTRHNPTQVLQEAATVYKVDTDAIALKVKQEFAAKEKAKKAAKPAAKVAKKAA